MWKIGDFSRLCQIPVKTLRYYDELGLLRPAHVNRSTGYRYYTADQLERLNRILVFKDLGFSLLEIRAFLAAKVPTDRLRGMLRRKREEVERRVTAERARLARVAARLDAIERLRHPEAYPEVYEIAVRRIGPRVVASMRGALRSYDESDRLFDELDRCLGARTAQQHRGAIWHPAAADGAIDCEALVFLAEPAAADRAVSVYEMPAHTAACLVYRGDTAYLAAYAALREWLDSSGLTPSGPKREVYLDEGRDRESVTEIQYPIEEPTHG